MTSKKSNSDNATHILQLTAPATPTPATTLLQRPRRPLPKAAGSRLVRPAGWAGRWRRQRFLWYLWKQDQTTRPTGWIRRSSRLSPSGSGIPALKTKITELEALQAPLPGQLRTEDQNLKDQLLGLTGDLQPLKNAMELQKGETDIVRNEVKLLREGQDTHKASTQQQKADLTQQLQEQQARIPPI